MFRRLAPVTVLRTFAPTIGFLAILLSAMMASPAIAQTNIEQGKSPAELFANDCAACHKTTRGLANGENSLSLSVFLREHYTASRDQAAALAAYVLANGGNAPAPKSTVEHARGEEPKNQEHKGQEAKGQEPKGQESKSQEPKGQEARGQEPKSQGIQGTESENPELKSRRAKSPRRPDRPSLKLKRREPRRRLPSRGRLRLLRRRPCLRARPVQRQAPPLPANPSRATTPPVPRDNIPD